MWAKIGFHEAADIIFQLWAAVVARRQLNEYLDVFCAHWIGYADGGGKGNSRMLAQAVLNLAGPDPIA